MKLLAHIIRFYEDNGNLPVMQDDVFMSLRADGVSCSSGSVSRRMREQNGRIFETVETYGKTYKKWKLITTQTKLLQLWTPPLPPQPQTKNCFYSGSV